MSSCPRLGRLRAPPPLMFAMFAGCPRRPWPPAPEPADVADDDDIAEAQAHGRRHRGVPEDRWILMTLANAADTWLRSSVEQLRIAFKRRCWSHLGRWLSATKRGVRVLRDDDINAWWKALWARRNGHLPSRGHDGGRDHRSDDSDENIEAHR